MSAASLTITSWNVRSLNKAAPYIGELLNSYHSDVLCIYEHRLYENELYKINDMSSDYYVYAKCSSDLNEALQSRQPGHCGVAILYKKSIVHKIRKVECNSDSICAIEVIGAYVDKSLFIINVYLPHQQCKISNFKQHVDILEDLVIKCRLQGEIVVIGDTNCHFDINVGHRFSGNTTANARYLKSASDRCQLEILDGNPDICKGPCYSFFVEGVGRSYVDHLLTSELVTSNVTNCEVIEDCVLNTSDHLPITVCINVYDLNTGIKEFKMSKVAWQKLNDTDISRLYTEPLGEQLVHISAQLNEIECTSSVNCISHKIDDIIAKIVKTINDISGNLPYTKFKSGLKPYWNSLLGECCKRKKAAWLKWMQRGKPRDTDPDFQNYKKAKRDFKHELSKAKLEYELKNINDINVNNEIDQAYFWKLVNKRKRQQNSVHPLKLKDGSVLTDPNEIRNAWKCYFEDLFTPLNNDKFDKDF